MARKRQNKNTAEKRNLILDTAQKIMLEEGYAAVSSRHIAEVAGCNSMPIHYHFGSMDDVFVAIYRRSTENYFNRLIQALSSDSALHDLWRLSLDPVDAGLLVEYLAIANHRQSLSHELARSAEQVRAIATAILTARAKGVRIDPGPVPPAVLAFILEAVCRALVSDRQLGISLAHDEVVAFVERLMAQIEPAHEPGEPKRRPRKPAPDTAKKP